ncbi:MAG: hypothetical protein HUU46_17800 [Candidatus Hydrogenedentes bacterium]|nr:hypothetical protein [Candidatus Hydrogenedentota bacterium]
MNEGYVYEQFGVWWIFIDPDLRGPIRLIGPYRTREFAQEALASLSITTPLPTAS